MACDGPRRREPEAIPEFWFRYRGDHAIDRVPGRLHAVLATTDALPLSIQET